VDRRGLFKHSIPDIGEVVEFFRWTFAGIYSNQGLTLPFAASASAGTWLALKALSRLPRDVRRRALAGGLFAAGAVAVTLTWARPDTPAPYGRSAFADLGAAVFVTAAGMLLALVASSRREPTRR
jgi:peptidoglycan/LPS O-acetylase OafA/YrhL